MNAVRGIVVFCEDYKTCFHRGLAWLFAGDPCFTTEHCNRQTASVKIPASGQRHIESDRFILLGTQGEHQPSNRA